MTTILQAAMAACGLSQAEAAELLGVRRDTLDRAANGRRPTPPGWLDELSRLYVALRRSADQAIQAAAGGVIRFPLARNAAEARALGYSCLGAYRAVLRMIWEAGTDLRLQEGSATNSRTLPSFPRQSSPAAHRSST